MILCMDPMVFVPGQMHDRDGHEPFAKEARQLHVSQRRAMIGVMKCVKKPSRPVGHQHPERDRPNDLRPDSDIRVAVEQCAQHEANCDQTPGPRQL